MFGSKELLETSRHPAVGGRRTPHWKVEFAEGYVLKTTEIRKFPYNTNVTVRNLYRWKIRFQVVLFSKFHLEDLRFLYLNHFTFLSCSLVSIALESQSHWGCITVVFTLGWWWWWDNELNYSRDVPCSLIYDSSTRIIATFQCICMPPKFSFTSCFA